MGSMDAVWRRMFWQQFGAAIGMLENAVRSCPNDLWCDRSRQPEFWYLAYHTLFWLDLYLSGSVEGFAPPAPFTLEELDPAGLIPGQPYAKEQLLRYLQHGREKCRAMILGLTDEQAARLFRGFGWVDVSMAELLVRNMRHVQHHAAQLNLLLRQSGCEAPRWVARTNDDDKTGR
jgi:hypothetical protein